MVTAVSSAMAMLITAFGSAFPVLAAGRAIGEWQRHAVAQLAGEPGCARLAA